MYSFIVTVHVILALVIIVSIVVFQTSKGSALSMFGGGGDSLFNAASGTSFIKKFTAGCAALFAVTSLLLTIFGANNRFRSVVQEYPLQQQQAPAAAPAQPGTPAPAAAPAKAAPLPEKK
ncbi:MAG: preprotein translocase subunit SecG [Elusimicrobiales bacterium]|nr:preprotein translocase subunit SecG [Elusimicrobiales bacterium]